MICGFFVCRPSAILLFMVAYPFISLLYYCVLNFSVLRPRQPAKPMGLRNYGFLLTDPELWERFIFTGKFVFIMRRLQMLIGIFVAYFLQKNFRGRDVIFTMLMMPMMLCPIVVGFLWRYMFNSEWGIVNFLLASVGAPKMDWLGQTTPHSWRRSSPTPGCGRPSSSCWRRPPSAAFPKNIYEAAEIDGAVGRLPLLPRHAADVGAGPVHRADPAPDRCLQAVSICSSR